VYIRLLKEEKTESKRIDNDILLMFIYIYDYIDTKDHLCSRSTRRNGFITMLAIHNNEEEETEEVTLF